MARDLNVGGEGGDGGDSVLGAEVHIDYIILVLRAKLRREHVRYLSAHLHRAPRTNTISEESSERVAPEAAADIAADNELSFLFPRDRAVFELRLRRDLPPELPQYELQLQVDVGGGKNICCHCKNIRRCWAGSGAWWRCSACVWVTWARGRGCARCSPSTGTCRPWTSSTGSPGPSWTRRTRRQVKRRSTRIAGKAPLHLRHYAKTNPSIFYDLCISYQFHVY